MIPEWQPPDQETDNYRAFIFAFEAIFPILGLGRLCYKAGLQPDITRYGALIALTDSARIILGYFLLANAAEIQANVSIPGVIIYGAIGAVGASIAEGTLDKFGVG